MRRRLFNKNIFFYAIAWLTVFGFNQPIFAQRLDSLRINLETAVAFSNRDYLPLWIVSNRFGKLEDQSPNGYFLAGMHSPYAGNKDWDFAWGADYLVNTEFSESRIHQGYAKVKYKIVELSAGWMERTVGVHRPELSTGSFSISRNARPLPSVILSIPEYTPVPFTKGYLEFRGHWGHGWFEEDRHISDAWLHEKSFYLQGKGKSFPMKAYIGLVHFAQWAGTRPNGRELDDSLADYWRVITGQSGRNPNVGVDFVNALGNHLGTIDFGFEFPLSNTTLAFYHQEPFEDKLGITRHHFYDQLSGLSWQREKSKFIQEVLYEFVYTKHQGGPGIPDPPPGTDWSDRAPNYGYRYGGRDDYYNNFLYQSGWNFYNRSIGTPLFINSQRAEKMGLDVPNYGEGFISNRISTHHLAVLGNYKKTEFKIFATYSRHFGTYAGLNGGRFEWGSMESDFNQKEYFFYQPKSQSSLLLETTRPFLPNRQLQTSLSLAFDFGNLYSSFGMLFKIRWNIHPFATGNLSKSD
ncbi:MAG: capsule assembly Wzi family protein [Bacteroidota bacterium]